MHTYLNIAIQYFKHAKYLIWVFEYNIVMAFSPCAKMVLP